MSQRQAGQPHDTDHDNVPELDDVVEPVVPEEKPPPNFDLFADAGIDRETLKAELRQALESELNEVMADVQHAIAEAIDASLETRIRRRLPELLERIFSEIETSRSGKG